MKKLIKEFCLRGLIFSGFGPIIYAIIMLILYLSNIDTQLNGQTLFIAIISTYSMAFIIAGSSIIWQVERLGLCLAIVIHGSILYVSYIITYLLNGWLDKDLLSVSVFTLIFLLGYLLIWLFIYLIEKNRAKQLNKKLK